MVSALITLAIFLISIRGFMEPLFTEKYLFDTAQIGRGKGYYRFISSGFLHGDYWHLIFNLLCFYSFASALEEYGALWVMVTVFISSIIGGNILSYLIHRKYEYRALGASGGVSGVIFAYVFLFPGSSIGAILLPFSIPSFLYALLFIVISIWGIRTQRDNIGHDAHLGGALVGVLVTTLFKPSIVVESPVLYSAVILICAIFFIYLYRRRGLLLMTSEPFSGIREQVQKVKKQHKRKKERHITLTVDEILLKVSREGMHSLTKKERAQLRDGADYFRTKKS